jgi:hypothetical protein
MGIKTKSLLIGTSVTLVLLLLAFSISASINPWFSRALFWQNTLLQSLIPPLNIGTAEHPVYEGTPLNILAFFASIPLGIAIYSTAAYFLIRPTRRGT